jgi:glycosyltransferase involved in cell wall biosynthesis
MRKPSICFISLPIYHLLADPASTSFCGGAELQQLLIGRGLADRGYSVSFITLDHGQGPEIRIGPFRVLGAYRPGTGLPVLRFYHPRLVGIMDALRRADADIYYMRGAEFLLAPMVLHASRTGKRVLFAGASNTDFDPRARHFHHARDRILYWWGLRRVDAVVAQNRTQAEGAWSQLGIAAEVIHNALPDEPVESSHSEYILWVGNLRPKKNPERFMDLAEAFPDHRFVMVGGATGSTHYPVGPTTTSGVTASMLPNVLQTGYLPPGEVAGHYGRARVLVNTSDVEGFPNTFLHAWSRGVPVLTYVDPDSVVRKNGLGWVVSSPDEMKRVLGGILNGELNLPREKIIDYYRAECMTPRQIDQYERVLAGMGGV